MYWQREWKAFTLLGQPKQLVAEWNLPGDEFPSRFGCQLGINLGLVPFGTTKEGAIGDLGRATG
jgi:hypothetical protein